MAKYLKKVLFVIVILLVNNIINGQSNNCLVWGTVVFKEDFGGNNPSDPVRAANDVIGGKSDLRFRSRPDQGEYGLLKELNVSYAHYTRDHTYPASNNRGYFMYLDPANGQMGATLYEYDIIGLCSGINDLVFSLWAVNVGTRTTPKIELQIIDKKTKKILVTTGKLELPQEKAAGNWRQYSLNFSMPEDLSDITFKVVNRENSTQGNDWAMDDIEIRICVPPAKVSINNKTKEVAIKNDEKLNLKAHFKDNKTFISDNSKQLEGYWAVSTTGNINKPEEWEEVPGTRKTLKTGVDTFSEENTVNSTIEGESFYRFIVSNTENIHNKYCRAASEVIMVTHTNVVIEEPVNWDTAKVVEIDREIKIIQEPVNVKKRTKVSLEVWDNNVEDGDIISLYVNNICVLEKHTLSKKKKRIRNIPVNPGKNLVVMYAENLGKIPPNTAAMSIHINDKFLEKHHLTSDLEVCEAIIIIEEEDENLPKEASN